MDSKISSELLSDPAFVAPDPEKMVAHALEHGKRGDPTSILKSMDEYCWKYAKRSMNIGDAKGVILDSLFKERDPKVAIELGSFVGYSAVRMARFLKDGGKLYCLEINPEYAKLVEKLVDYAGLLDKICIIVGTSDEVIPTLKAKHGIDKLDFVFIDHMKALYKPDLISLIKNDLLAKGSVVVADNVIYPGAPEYLEYVRNEPLFKSTFFKSHLEYRPEVEDGLEKSVFLGK
ncbi:catechol O-methyltransferase A-like [Styela clava]